MRSRTFFHMEILVLITCLLAACLPGMPVGTPNPPGATVEVGGWRTAETILKGYSMRIETSGGAKKSGWQVTIMNVSPGPDNLRLDMKITNTTNDPGAIDLTRGLKLIDAQGTKYLPVMANPGMDDDIPIDSSRSVSASVNCHMTAPNAAGIQQATCAVILTVSDGLALLSVGAGQTVDVSFIFPVPAETDSLLLEWLDGTQFMLP